MQSKNKFGSEELRPQNSSFDKRQIFLRNIFGGGGGRRFGQKCPIYALHVCKHTCASTLVREDILFLSLFQLVSKGNSRSKRENIEFFDFFAGGGGGGGQLKGFDWSAQRWQGANQN